MADLSFHLPITSENVSQAFDEIFAPWVKSMGLFDISVSKGKASATLPQSHNLQWANGATCGQAIMAAIDTVVSLAMLSTDRFAKGTASQNTQFLKPAFGDDLRIEVNVLRFGKVIAYAETKVYFVESGDLVAHATNEFVF
ncbi:MAG: PaaI family thioesterase [Pseudohongiellaceae bacterium]